MKILVKYNKKKFCFYIKIKKYLFLYYNIRKYLNKKINISIILYNYFLILRFLRQFGLIKPILNSKDFF